METANKIYTGRIYWYKKIREQLPDAELINIQRKPWRYTPSWITKSPDLGPPIDLFYDTSIILKYATIDIIDESSLKRFQEHYTNEYINHLKNGEGTKEAVNELIQQILTGKDIVLLCCELPGQFCHRVLLHDFICNIVGSEYAGNELDKED